MEICQNIIVVPHSGIGVRPVWTSSSGLVVWVFLDKGLFLDPWFPHPENGNNTILRARGLCGGGSAPSGEGFGTGIPQNQDEKELGSKVEFLHLESLGITVPPTRALALSVSHRHKCRSPALTCQGPVPPPPHPSPESHCPGKDAGTAVDWAGSVSVLWNASSRRFWGKGGFYTHTHSDSHCPSSLGKTWGRASTFKFLLAFPVIVFLLTLSCYPIRPRLSMKMWMPVFP